MVKETIISLYERDLDRLKVEIQAYENESVIWEIAKDIKNSGGNLCLHICGNLQHFVGTGLGKTDYVRDREAEFALKDVPVETLEKSIDETKKVVRKVILGLSEVEMEAPIPEDLFRGQMSTIAFILHLHAHLNYHLGQINYHRRLLS